MDEIPQNIEIEALLANSPFYPLQCQLVASMIDHSTAWLQNFQIF